MYIDASSKSTETGAVSSQHRAPSRHRCANIAMCRHSYFCLLDVPSLRNARHSFHRRVWYFCAVRVFEVGHHPHSVGYLCAKFRFFRGLQCWASPWRKIAYSFNQSLSHSLIYPAYLMPREPKLSLRNEWSIHSAECCRCKTEAIVVLWETSPLISMSTF